MVMSMNEKKRNEAQEYLSQIELCDKQINNKLEELSRLNALALKVTSSLKQVAVFGSGSQDKIGDAVSRIVDLQREINEDIDRYCDRKAEARALIEKVKDPDQFDVLSKRYLLYKSFEQIACEMGFTYRNVCYIHGRALQTVTELMKGGEGDG